MKKLKRLLIFIYIVVFSFAIGYFSGYIDDSTANYEAIKESYGFFIHFIKLFLLALAILSQVVLHELGHLVAGLAKGYEFIMFRVGNLALVKRQEGFTLGRFNIPGTGGQALLAPKAKAYSNYSYKLYMYGGVISNLIFSFSAVFFFIFAKEYFLRVFLLYFFAMGMISAAFNGIAFSSAIANDAMNAKYMDMHEEYRIFTSYSLKLSKFLANGKGLSDFGEDEINYLKKTNFEFAEGYVLLGDYYSELLEEKLAEKYYKKALNKEFLTGGLQKMSVVNELVYISLVNGKTEDFNSYYTEDYKEFLDKYLSKMIIGFYSRYALALLMESDEKKSEDIKKEFYRYSKKYIFTGSIKDAKNKIETVDQLYYK